MPLDVVDLRTFYHGPLGKVARRCLAPMIRERWPSCVGLSVLGLGYATPYLEAFKGEAMRTLAFMPAEQGVVNWPAQGLTSSALVEPALMPLPDSSVDRVLVVHGLEASDHPRDLLAEVWRILTPGGRLILVTPSRRGLWARVDATPFGHGQPFSRSQLRNLMRETLFSPIHWAEALYAPPFERRLLLRLAPVIERVGRRLALPGAGLHLVEATKQLYRPLLAGRPARQMLRQQAPAVAVTSRR